MYLSCGNLDVMFDVISVLFCIYFVTFQEGNQNDNSKSPSIFLIKLAIGIFIVTCSQLVFILMT